MSDDIKMAAIVAGTCVLISLIICGWMLIDSREETVRECLISNSAGSCGLLYAAPTKEAP